MVEEEKNPGASPPPNIQPDSVSDDEVFAPRDDMNALFYTKDANGELTNTLNINTNIILFSTRITIDPGYIIQVQPALPVVFMRKLNTFCFSPVKSLILTAN